MIDPQLSSIRYLGRHPRLPNRSLGEVCVKSRTSGYRIWQPRGGPWHRSRWTVSARCTPTVPRLSRTSIWRSATASSWSSSALRGAVRRPRCAWLPGSRRSPRGTVSIGDRVVNEVPPKDRDIAMVFQNYALYPHMTVSDNMAFGLRLRKAPKDEITTRVRQAADDPRARGSLGSQARRTCRGASASGLRWAARSCASRSRSSWTSRCRTWTPSSGCRCVPRSLGSSGVRRHHDLRHARPGGGDDDGRPRRRDAARASSSRSTPRRCCTTPRRICSSRGSSDRRR